MPAVPDYWSYRYGYAVERGKRTVSDGVGLLDGFTLTSAFADTSSWRYGVIFDIVLVIHSLSLPLADGRYATLSLRSGG